MSALFLLLCPQDSHPFPSGHSEYCSQVTLSRLSVSQKCVWRWNISRHSELPHSLWSAYTTQGTMARTGCDLDDCLCLCVSQSAAVLPKAPAPTSPKLVTTSRRETFFFPSFLPTLWSSDSLKSRDFLEWLCVFSPPACLCQHAGGWPEAKQQRGQWRRTGSGQERIQEHSRKVSGKHG